MIWLLQQRLRAVSWPHWRLRCMQPLLSQHGMGLVPIDGKNSTEPQKSTQKHVFWGLTKNTEKRFYHLGYTEADPKTLKNTCFWV